VFAGDGDVGRVTQQPRSTQAAIWPPAGYPGASLRSVVPPMIASRAGSADLVGNLADVIAVFCCAERGDLCLVLHRLEVGPTSGSA
jgi:hypothetical protein